MQFMYSYDKTGNIVSEKRTENGTTNSRLYEYDSANQLVSFADNDYTEAYVYDNAGNMVEKQINNQATTYTYNKGNQLISELTNSTKGDYIYNFNGDLVEKSTGEKYTYDVQGNLTSIVGNDIDKRYTYNGNGNRLSEITENETIYYVNDLNRQYEEVLQTYDEQGNTINTYTYGLDRIQSQGKDNETYIYDGRGSVVGAVGDNDILESYSYTAYGELMPNSPEPKVFGFNAEATDYATGMQYLRARYYDTSINRFIQEDDYRGEYSEPETMNRYIYVHNNPVMGIDPSGYYSSGVPTNVQKILKLREQKKAVQKKSEYYKNKYTPKQKKVTVSKYLDNNKKITNNTVIVPDALVPGKAGYWNGAFCSDGGAKAQQYLGEGAPDFVKQMIIDANFVAMSEDEVDTRNEIMVRGLDFFNVISIVDETAKSEYISGRKEYTDTIDPDIYYFTLYSQTGQKSPEELREIAKKGSFIEDGKVKHGADCSSLVSYAWGLEERLTVANLEDCANNEYDDKYGEKAYGITGEVTHLNDFKSIAPGDAIFTDGHIRLVLNNKDGIITFGEQTIDTTPNDDSESIGGTNIRSCKYTELNDYSGITIDKSVRE